MPEIIRYEDRVCDVLYSRFIFGLTIFNVNQVDGVEDAMVTFLRSLVQTYPCAAQIGMEPLVEMLGEEPRAIFAPLQEGEDYVLTHVNSDSHGPLWVEPDRPAGCFFPHLTESFFELTTKYGWKLINSLLNYDQPFLYVNVDQSVLAHIEAVYASPPPSDGREYCYRWWEEMTLVVPLGLWGGFDNAMITAYSRDPDNLRLLETPIEETCNAIRRSSWFQKHQHELRWPEEEIAFYKWCLMLPDLIEEEKAREAQRQMNLQKMKETGR